MWTNKTCVFHKNQSFFIKNHHRRPKSLKSLQISLGGRKKCDLWWFLNAFGKPKCTKNHKKTNQQKHRKNVSFSESLLEWFWGIWEGLFHYFFTLFRVPKANQRKIGREAIHTVKTILLSRSDLPKKTQKSTKNHSKVNKKTPLNPKPAKSAFWEGFWLRLGSQNDMLFLKNRVSEKGLWKSLKP